jgi:hypothetical protein
MLLVSGLILVHRRSHLGAARHYRVVVAMCRAGDAKATAR